MKFPGIGLAHQRLVTKDHVERHVSFYSLQVYDDDYYDSRHDPLVTKDFTNRFFETRASVEKLVSYLDHYVGPVDPQCMRMKYSTQSWSGDGWCLYGGYNDPFWSKKIVGIENHKKFCRAIFKYGI